MSVFTNPAAASKEHAAAYIAAVLDLLGDRDPLEVLRATPAAFARALEALTAAQAVQPERQGKWSVRHVVQHLADSELVWGWRLRRVLAHDRPRLEGYDQDLWADRLRYDDVVADDAFAEFSTLRASNLRLLARVAPEDLQRVGVHDERGEESVAHLMRLYAGHDLLHVAQLERIRAAVA
jgi:uncharacterized damage-inducible protein DinB